MVSRMSIASAVAIAAVIAITATAVAWGSGSKRTLHGSVRNQPDSRVIVKPQDAGARVSLEFRRLSMFCEGGTERNAFIGPVSTKVRPSGRFELDEYRVAGGFNSPGSSFLWIKGQLRRNGSARGTVFLYSNPYDPPGEPSDLPECSSAGKRSWTAK